MADLTITRGNVAFRLSGLPFPVASDQVFMAYPFLTAITTARPPANPTRTPFSIAETGRADVEPTADSQVVLAISQYPVLLMSPSLSGFSAIVRNSPQ
jgi:hypothetical protein